LSVGTFSQTFLATWRQSQTDQAALAIGAPVRVPADGSLGAAELPLLAKGARGVPQPVIRRLGAIAPAGSDAYADPESGLSDGSAAAILGLTAGDRSLISRGRLGTEGGTKIATLLGASPSPAKGLLLPSDAAGVGATVLAGDAGVALPNTTVGVSALLQDPRGMISTLELGSVAADGQPHQLEGVLRAAVKGAGFDHPLRLVGLQSRVLQVDGIERAADVPSSGSFAITIQFAGLTALKAAQKGADPALPLPSVPLKLDDGVSWRVNNPDQYDALPVLTTGPNESPFTINAVIPSGGSSGPTQLIISSWIPAASIPAVLSEGLAKQLHVFRGTTLALAVPGAKLAITVAGIVPLVPGSLSGVQPDSAINDSVGGQPDTVVVDHTALSRVLAQAGVTGPMVEEWWVDVPAGAGQAYLDKHPTRDAIVPAQSTEVRALQMQQDPMRVSAQAALWLAILGAALLAAAGFAVHTSASLRSRRTELAQLRAIGLSRRMLVGLIGAESLLVCALATVFGVGLGIVLGLLVAPLIAVSPSGAPTLPSVLVTIPWAGIGLLVVIVLAILAAVVLAVARAQRSSDPASILRGADE
ncbi:MAG: ABC transporter permease, partial [Lacisediminihabitans sp.]